MVQLSHPYITAGKTIALTRQNFVVKVMSQIGRASCRERVLEKTFENPLDYKEIKPSDLKEINPEYSLEGLMLKLQYLGHLMQKFDSLVKTLILGKIENGRRG